MTTNCADSPLSPKMRRKRCPPSSRPSYYAVERSFLPQCKEVIRHVRRPAKVIALTVSVEDRDRRLGGQPLRAPVNVVVDDDVTDDRETATADTVEDGGEGGVSEG